MANFDPAYKIVQWHEWGSSGIDPHEDNPDDEPTGYGLIEDDFVEARHMGLVPADVGPLNVMEDQARAIGRCLYWDKMTLDLIPNQDVANKLFDMAYVMGVGRAVRRVQEALNDVGQDYVHIDGILGPQTRLALAEAVPTRLLARFRERCVDYYELIAENHPEDRQWLAGWLDRVKA